MAIKDLLKTAGFGAVAGACVYLVNDFVSEITTLHILRDAAIKVAEADADTVRQLGQPLTPGPWYNSSVGLKHGGQLAQCTFPVLGQGQATDMTVAAVRPSGYLSTALYNLVGGGEWRVVKCIAMMPAGGGLVKPRHLIKPPAPRQPQQEQQRPAGSDSVKATAASAAVPSAAAQK